MQQRIVIKLEKENINDELSIDIEDEDDDIIHDDFNIKENIFVLGGYFYEDIDYIETKNYIEKWNQ